MDEYQEELSRMITRWSRPFVDYWMSRIHRDIEKFALWSMEAMNFPTTENSVLTSNQCEAMNRINAEQQNWQEMSVDKAFLIGRDIQKAKVYEMARGMMGLGNFELLPEFKSKFNSKVGEDLLRRLGSTPSFEEIVSRHKESRNLSRHAGAGSSQTKVNRIDEEEEESNLDLNENNTEDIEIEIIETPFNTVSVALNKSVELQEVSEEFDLDESFENPVETSSATDDLVVVSTPKVAAAQSTTIENEETSETVDPICDEITYIPQLDAYFSPGSNFPTSVQLKKNLCSQCGYCPPRNWCPHLRNAGIKAGMNVKAKTPVLKSLTLLRKKQRIEKSKSGKKAPRRFDIVPLHKEINNEKESEMIALELAETYPVTERNSYDDTIEAVVAAAGAFADAQASSSVPPKRKLSFEDINEDNDLEKSCSKRSKTSEHELESQNPPDFECSHCPFKSTTKCGIEEHMGAVHRVSCDFCDNKFASDDELQGHFRETHDYTHYEDIDNECELDNNTVPDVNSHDEELRLVLDETLDEPEQNINKILTIKQVTNGYDDILDLPKRKKQQKPVYLKNFTVALLPRNKK